MAEYACLVSFIFVVGLYYIWECHLWNSGFCKRCAGKWKAFRVSSFSKAYNCSCGRFVTFRFLGRR